MLKTLITQMDILTAIKLFFRVKGGISNVPSFLAVTHFLVDDQCVIKLLTGLCLKHLAKLSEAEELFVYIHLK